MRLGKFSPLVEGTDGTKGKDELNSMRIALTDTLTEVRNISRGLSLPHLEDVTLEQTILLAVTLHREQTGGRVELTTTALPNPVPQAVKVCVYRVVQESLTNGFRHGKGIDQKATKPLWRMTMRLTLTSAVIDRTTARSFAALRTTRRKGL